MVRTVHMTWIVPNVTPIPSPPNQNVKLPDMPVEYTKYDDQTIWDGSCVIFNSVDPVETHVIAFGTASESDLFFRNKCQWLRAGAT